MEREQQKTKKGVRSPQEMEKQYLPHFLYNECKIFQEKQVHLKR